MTVVTRRSAYVANQSQTYTGTRILSLLSHKDVEVLALLQPEVPCEVNTVGPAGDQYASTSGRTIRRDSGVGGDKENMVLRWRNQSNLQQTYVLLQIHLEAVCETAGQLPSPRSLTNAPPSVLRTKRIDRGGALQGFSCKMR